jgi:hypothetical protein
MLSSILFKAGFELRQQTFWSPKLPLLLTPLTYIIHMDVVNADIAGANICPCRQSWLWIFTASALR